MFLSATPTALHTEEQGEYNYRSVNTIMVTVAAEIYYLLSESEVITGIYYMALSHKDWELPNSRIWLAEMDFNRGLDFPI